MWQNSYPLKLENEALYMIKSRTLSLAMTLPASICCYFYSASAHDALCRRRQEDGEEIHAFANALQDLAEQCKFGKRLDEELTHQFLTGLRRTDIKTHLTKTKHLTFQKVVKMADKLERNMDSAREAFHQMRQTDGESAYDFSDKLRQQAESCCFVDKLDEELTHQFVSGLRIEAIKTELCDTDHLTLQKALDTATTMEHVIFRARETFHQMRQTDGESAYYFSEELRLQAKHCHFGDKLHEKLTHQFVGSLRIEAIKNKLADTDHLTLPMAVDTATTMEQACEPFCATRQENGERARSFSWALEDLAEPCEFGENLDEELTRQFVTGLRQDAISATLRNTENLSFQMAVNIADELEGYDVSTPGAFGQQSTN